MTSCAEFLLLGVDETGEGPRSTSSVSEGKEEEGARRGNRKEQTEAPTR